jgi:fucose permease
MSFGGWIFTYVLKMGLGNETNAAYLTSAFWGALTIGRLAAIPLAPRFSPRAVLRADFTGALVSLLSMLFWPRSLFAVVITSVGLGFALASIYPTAMSLAGQMTTLSGKVASLLAIGSNVGSMLVPLLIGQFFESAAGPQSMAAVLVFVMLLGLVVMALLKRRVATPPRS